MLRCNMADFHSLLPSQTYQNIQKAKPKLQTQTQIEKQTLDSPMNQNLPPPPILPLPQRPLDPRPRALELPKEILVIDIVNRDAQVLVPVPAGDALEVELQDGQDVRDPGFCQRGLAPEGEDAEALCQW